MSDTVARQAAVHAEALRRAKHRGCHPATSNFENHPVMDDLVKGLERGDVGELVETAGSTISSVASGTGGEAGEMLGSVGSAVTSVGEATHTGPGSANNEDSSFNSQKKAEAKKEGAIMGYDSTLNWNGGSGATVRASAPNPLGPLSSSPNRRSGCNGLDEISAMTPIAEFKRGQS